MKKGLLFLFVMAALLAACNPTRREVAEIKTLEKQLWLGQEELEVAYHTVDTASRAYFAPQAGIPTDTATYNLLQRISKAQEQQADIIARHNRLLARCRELLKGMESTEIPLEVSAEERNSIEADHEQLMTEGRKLNETTAAEVVRLTQRLTP